MQDYNTKRVHPCLYEPESLKLIKEKQTCFWSRSRRKLWRKGETSGNYQRVVNVTVDCDGDALLVEVKKDGPACHLGNDSCFEFPVFAGETRHAFSIDTLYDLLKDRKENRPEGSYTTYLLKGKGENQKIGRRAASIIAAMKCNREETIYEPDLLYHSLVLMAQEVTPDDPPS